LRSTQVGHVDSVREYGAIVRTVAVAGELEDAFGNFGKLRKKVMRRGEGGSFCQTSGFAC